MVLHLAFFHLTIHHGFVFVSFPKVLSKREVILRFSDLIQVLAHCTDNKDTKLNSTSISGHVSLEK